MKANKEAKEVGNDTSRESQQILKILAVNFLCPHLSHTPKPHPQGEDTGGEEVLIGLGKLPHPLPPVSGHSDEVNQEAGSH